MTHFFTKLVSSRVESSRARVHPVSDGKPTYANTGSTHRRQKSNDALYLRTFNSCER